jgi:tetratricopeptide (TPR) repeat protein
MSQEELSEKEMWNALPELAGAEKAKLLIDLSRVAHRRGSYFESLELAQASLKEYESISCVPNEQLAEAYLNLANAYRAVKNDPEAMATVQRAVAIAKEDNYPFLDDLLRSQAIWYGEIGDWEAALNTHLEAALFNELNGCDEWMAKSLYNVGLCYGELKMFEEAISALRRALTIFVAEKKVSESGLVYCALGCYLADVGSADEALMMAGKALNIAEIMQERVSTMWAQYVRGKALVVAREFEAAEKALSDAYHHAISCKAAEMDWNFIIKVHDERANLLRSQDRVVEADEVSARIQTIKEIYLDGGS